MMKHRRYWPIDLPDERCVRHIRIKPPGRAVDLLLINAVERQVAPQLDKLQEKAAGPAMVEIDVYGSAPGVDRLITESRGGIDFALAFLPVGFRLPSVSRARAFVNSVPRDGAADIPIGRVPFPLEPEHGRIASMIFKMSSAVKVMEWPQMRQAPIWRARARRRFSVGRAPCGHIAKTSATVNSFGTIDPVATNVRHPPTRDC
jgi:hypothetical protein